MSSSSLYLSGEILCTVSSYDLNQKLGFKRYTAKFAFGEQELLVKINYRPNVEDVGLDETLLLRFDVVVTIFRFSFSKTP